MAEQEMNIYQKLAKIRKQVEVIQKNKAGYGYKYVSEDEILAKITVFMDKYNLSLLPSIERGTTTVAPYTYKKTKSTKSGEIYEENNNEVLVSADMTWSWVNNDNPEERVTVPWSLVGQQSDASQAFGSGLTYSNRYFLLKFFNIASFVHKLIDMHYKDGLSAEEMSSIYLRDFKKEVLGRAPSNKVFASYFKGGLQYLRDFEPLPYEVIETEKKVEFKVGEIPLIGYIDYLGKKDGELLIIDNKSRTLKQRSTRAKPTKTDLELDAYLRQLYIYAAAVEQEYGNPPKYLGFNCFRTGDTILEPFNEEAYAEAKQWFIQKVAEITEESDFRPDVDWFKCQFLCECRSNCEYFDLATR